MPSFVAYAASFAVVGIVWINHHGLFRLVARTDNRLKLANLLLLATISFLPFPTAVVAQAHGHGADETTALLLYSGTTTLMAIAFNLVWCTPG